MKLCKHSRVLKGMGCVVTERVDKANWTKEGMGLDLAGGEARE